MRKLLKYLKGYTKECILGPLFKLLEASFELLVPLVLIRMIDNGIKQNDASYIWKMGGLMIALGIIGLVCSITAQYFAAKAATGFSARLRKELFDHIQRLSYTEMDQIGTSTLITRMTSDINQVQNGVNLVLRLFLRSPFIVFGAMVMAFTIDVRSALIFAVTIPILSIVVFGIMLISIPLYRKVQNRLDRVLLLTRENLTGVRVIRAFNKEREERERFVDANADLVKEQIFVGKISALMNPLTYVIVNLMLLVLIRTGALQVEGGFLTQGAVVALINYMSQILVELIKLANLIITVTKAAACGNRIQSIFETQTSLSDGVGVTNAMQTDEVVVFDHVTFAYAGASADSLTDINLRVKKGQTVGIIGGTGSGKTTLVNLIARFYDASTGNVFVNGHDVREYQLSQLRAKIGLVPQKALLFKGSIAENLHWGDQSASEAQLNEALNMAQAADFVVQKKDGLNAAVQQGGSNLSGGQRQRLTIARALVRHPEILILDDSASALDYATDARLRQAIKAGGPPSLRSSGLMTVFIVSQRTASIWHADQIVVLDEGAVAGIGTHDQLLSQCKVYQEIYYSQFPKGGQANA